MYSILSVSLSFMNTSHSLQLVGLNALISIEFIASMCRHFSGTSQLPTGEPLPRP